ncbi:TetR/AcrR family transcriptional regulator [Dactylosporangium roseum]|uniref:TetR/AcrR family transcriptional regulator n=1 Tax=Dactylosporangium roseum TaxID=47989 RepID=A0ABY5ZDI8_9ACTN|nr:TetR/AcrR family transcriptional regulator [Dactylosporangium roseum]UWZ39487.1 TetR/AcrR family transcriptional regulator [Dactylosporangium roseum]
MTDLIQARSSSKRDRLVRAACSLFHQRGVGHTSLADIAKTADVQIGNVYYYFKTKDDIIRAVIDSHADHLRAGLKSLDRHRSPAARLTAFVREVVKTGPDTARYGCPHGTLCSELGRRDDDLTGAASVLMGIRLDWARAQFQAMGRTDADDLAYTLVAQIQGAALLANTFRDPAVLVGQTRRLQRWIKDLAGLE